MTHTVPLAHLTGDIARGDDALGNRGGKREGAGNKAEDPDNPKTVPVSSKISEQEAAQLDKERAGQSRSEWIRAAILAYFKEQPQ